MAKTEIRVIYGDTDQMGVVYYGNYLRFFEAARNDFLREKGARWRDVESTHGIYLPVVEAKVNYKRPAFYDDLLGGRDHAGRIGARVAAFRVPGVAGRRPAGHRPHRPRLRRQAGRHPGVPGGALGAPAALNPATVRFDGQSVLQLKPMPRVNVDIPHRLSRDEARSPASWAPPPAWSRSTAQPAVGMVKPG
jgi:YbgC/YbaW family acyl-CoA thioester hydrolase